MEKIKSALKESGLTEKETSAYMALLKLGNASAYTVSEKTGIKPSTTYLTLENLMTKGLVYAIPRTKKQLYAAISPRDVVAQLEDRLERTKRILPDMLAMAVSDAPKINVQFYKGVAGIQEALEYGYKHGRKSKEVLGFFATGESASDECIEMSKKHILALHKNGIPMRGITPSHPTIKEIKKMNDAIGNKLRMIPYADYSAKTSIEAEDEFVRIVMFEERKALIIDDKDLAQTIKQIFEMIWNK